MKKILDIGCGTGYRTFVLSKKKDTTVYGVDISKESIQLAKKRYPNGVFQVGDAEKLPFKNNSFDEVHAVDVLEHVDNLLPILKEIARVLKSGGKFIALVPAERSEKWLLSLRPTYHKEIHHVRIFKTDDLPVMVKKHGFTKTKHQRQNFIQHIEFYYFFKFTPLSTTQLAIGDWRNNYISMFVHAFVSSFDPYWVFNTPLKYIVPLWVVTLPTGYLVNFFGNKVMPKSNYYEFIKT